MYMNVGEIRKKEREQKNISLLTTQSGEIILDEEEFRALTHLKQVSHMSCTATSLLEECKAL